MAGVVVHHEILREQLQHHAVFAELDAQARSIARFTSRCSISRGRPSSMRPRLLAPRTVVPPIPTTAASIEICARRFRLAQHLEHALGDRVLIGDPALHPAARFALAVPQEPQPLVLDQAHHAARAAAAGVEPTAGNALSLMAPLFPP